MKKISAMVACILVVSAVLLVSCGNGASEDLDIVELDSEIEKEVSTLTIGEDSFTFPCATYEIIECGYSDWKFEITHVNPIKGKTRKGYFTVCDDDDLRLSVFVINTEEEDRQLEECLAYAVEILTEGEGREWTYMGITPESGPEDVEEVFEGILEFQTWENNGGLRLIHEDRDRLISFYWGNGAENGITQFMLEVYPEGEYRNYDIDYDYYVIPDNGQD